jgi:serine/threonine-protein kinase
VSPTISPDGRHLVIRTAEAGSSNLMMLDLEPGREGKGPSAVTNEPRPLVQTPFEETNPEISPDGRWLAYQSNNSGRFEVYVRPFPDAAAGQWLISTDGGIHPLWSRDGRELFYRAPDGGMMRVPLERSASWAAGTPVKLFDGGAYMLGPARAYDVSRDGQRFLMIKTIEAGGPPPDEPRIHVVQGWFEELTRLGPAN